jgi:hypothetical protein
MIKPPSRLRTFALGGLASVLALAGLVYLLWLASQPKASVQTRPRA